MKLTLDVYKGGVRIAVIDLDTTDDLPAGMLSWLEHHIQPTSHDLPEKPRLTQDEPYAPY